MIEGELRPGPRCGQDTATVPSRLWQMVRLSEIAEVLMGTSPPGASYNDRGEGVPLINGPVEFSDGDFGLTVRSKFTTSPIKMCETGDLIVCVRGSTTGRTNIAAFDACIGRGVAAIRTREHQQYINHFIRTQRAVIFASGNGSTFPSVSQSQISDIRIPLPPLREQKRIADILDMADAILCKRRNALQLAEDLPQNIFHSMFDAVVADDASRRPLTEVAEVVSGVAKGRKFNGAETVNAPYLRVANVQAGFLDLTEIKTIEALPREVDELRLMRGDVVLTEGGDFDKLGRGALWDSDIANCIHQNHVFRVRVNRDLLLPEYFAAFLQSTAARAYFLRCAKKTSNLASINMRQLRALPVPVPPIEAQQAFAVAVRKAKTLTASATKAGEESERLFAALAHRAFRGDL